MKAVIYFCIVQTTLQLEADKDKTSRVQQQLSISIIFHATCLVRAVHAIADCRL